MSTVTVMPTGKPAWSRDAAIGDYGGALDKEDCRTEASVPYAYAVYRELIAMKGSAYSSQPGTLVHCQNLAKARLLAFACFRLPEQFRANSLPGTADDALGYWVEVLGIPTKPNDQRWQIRQRCAAHYRATTSVNLPTIREALQDLLGDAYVDASFQVGASMSSPPTLTFWPGVAPGDSSYSLGGGTWASERSHLAVQVTQPPGMSDGDFYQLMNVQQFSLLDRMLPAFCTFNYATSVGFLLDISQLDFAAPEA